jgi:alkanesulfonate monooxygenase SsuD/methylene tetrahydromethanopterin reductase-like flavin-dependent oxidoreductase (luciferase family)
MSPSPALRPASIGMTLLPKDLAPYRPSERARLLAAFADAGLDHVHCGDHVSFHDGYGWDGFVNAATFLALHDTLPVHLGLYLLPLRHPMTVARQLASLWEYAGSRLVFGVGIGGDDRREVELCGVDPRTRGRRMDECLTVLRALLGAEPLDFEGEFFRLERAVVRPAPEPAIPILVGGRSEAAVRRAARFGDGWIGIWASPRRFAEVTARIAETAAAGAREVAWRHSIVIWCGLDDDRAAARRAVAEEMHSFYKLPSGAFERWCPAGSPEEVAEFVRPYVEAGAQDVSLIARGGTVPERIERAARVRRLVLGS